MTLNARILVVAGGGGGGADMGGGGGAGGYLHATSFPISPTYDSYLVTVGAGGTGAPAGYPVARGNSGESSGFVPQGFKGHSFNFDGNGDYLSIPSGMNVDSLDFSVEAYIFPVAWTTEWSSVFSTRASSSTSGATDVWVLGVHNSGYPYIYSGAMQITGTAGQITLNTWTHLAVTRENDSMRLFVNGVLVNTTSSNQNYSQSAGAIGANRNGSEPWTGYISNLRIVKGTAVYTSNFTPSTSPLTAVTGTSLLTAQDLSFADNSGNGNVLSINGNTSISHFTPFSGLALGAAGGGGGASNHNVATSPGSSGGSGGGGSGGRQSSASNGGLPGSGITGQGNNGAGSGVTWYPGGGGGAGAAASQTGSQQANGGSGIENDILGTAYYWAGGGAGAGYSIFGGNGGLGGGGGGAPRQSDAVTTNGQGGGSALNSGANAEIGTTVAQTNKRGGSGGANTGGGGGGGSHYSATNNGGNGGSGIVVIRYSGKPKAVGGTITTVGSDTVHTFLSSGSFTLLRPNGGQGGPYGGGGGGAKGWSDQGGSGASGAALSAGSSAAAGGGGGGGGGSSETLASGGGGGVGILGRGATGSGGAVGQPGTPGSQGQLGVNGNGGLYGGGGSGSASTPDTNRGNGGGGAVAIRWGSVPVIYPLGAPDVFTNTSGSIQSQGISGPFQQPDNSMVLLRNFNIIGPDVGPTRVLASFTFITVNITDRETMLRNDDPNAIATTSTPQNFQKFEEVTPLNDPRLVTVRVNNFIPGVTGEDGEGLGGGPPQIWY